MWVVTLVSWSAWAASTAPDLLSAAGYEVCLSAVGRGFHVLLDSHTLLAPKLSMSIVRDYFMRYFRHAARTS